MLKSGGCAQAQRFVRSAVFGAVTLGLAFVLDVAVTLGFAFQVLLRSCVFVTRLSSNGEFGGWERTQNVSTLFQTCGVAQTLVKLT